MKKLFYELCFGAMVLLSGINTMSYVFMVMTNICLKDKVSDLINPSDKGLDLEYSIDEIDSSMFEIDNIVIDLDSEFDYHDYVHICTKGMIDLSSYVSMEGEVDTSRSGEYPVKFYLRWNGNYLARSAKVYVRGGLNLYKLYGKAMIGDELVICDGDGDIVISMMLESEDFVIENLLSGRYTLSINKTVREFEIIDSNLDLGEL